MSDKVQHLRIEPKLRFKQFKAPYKCYKLKHLMERHSSNNKDKEFSIDDILSLSSIHGVVDRKELLDDTYSKVNHLNYIKTRLDDFVYGKSISASYPYGLFKANRLRDGLLSTLYFTFRTFDNVDTAYLDKYFSHLNRANNFLRKYVLVGDRYITADANYILEGEIYIPSLEEQIEIVHLFDVIDKKIVILEKYLENLKLFKKGIILKMVNIKQVNDKFITSVPVIRFKEFTDAWIVKSLSEILCDNLLPVDKPIDAYLRLGLRSHAKGVFHSANTDPASISVDTLYKVEKDNLIVNITFAWEHAVAITTSDDEGSLVSHRFPTYSFNEHYDPNYFEFWIKRKRFKYDLGVASPGGAGRNRVLNKKEFKKIKACIPKYKEQLKIASFIESIDKKIQNEEVKLENLKQFKKGLLQQMFI